MILRVEKGSVVEIYQGLPSESLELIKSLHPLAKWVETDLLVSRGDPWPLVPMETPAPTELPKQTLATVVMELERLVSQKKQEYLTKWPSTSQNDLWPLFAVELARVAEGLEVSNSTMPAMAGALSVRLGLPVEQVPKEAITQFAQGILGAKTHHAQELTRLEEAYQIVLRAFEQQGSIDVSKAFKVAYGS